MDWKAFWRGFGSVLCVVPRRYHIDPTWKGRRIFDTTIEEAMKSDWDAVMGDLRAAERKVREELIPG